MKRATSLLLVLLICVGMAVPAAAAETASGACSDTAFWSFKDGTLTISGTGAINSSFANCPWAGYEEQIRKVIIGEGITEIGNACFIKAVNLEQVQLPDSLEVIELQAFAFTKLTEITIPKNVSRIGDGGTFNPPSYSFPNTLLNIWVDDENPHYYDVDGVLYNADNQELVFCPHGREITSFYVPDGVKVIGGAAFINMPLESVRLPEGLTTINNFAFWGTNLKSITIPDTVTTLKESVFNACDGLTEVTFPASVELIGKDTFSYCDNVEKVTFLNPNCVIGEGANNIPPRAVIAGYSGSTAEKWAKQYGRDFLDLESGKLTEGNLKYGMLALLPTDIAVGYPVSNNGYSYNKDGSRNGYQPHTTMDYDTSDPVYQEVLALTKEISKDCATDYDKAKVISEWVSDNLEYSYGGLGFDFGVQKNLNVVWEEMYGNCEVFTALTNLMLYHIGLPTAKISNHGHTWSAALIDGRWVMMDSTNRWFDNTNFIKSDTIETIFFTEGGMVYVVDDFSGVKLASYAASITDNLSMDEITIPSYVTHIYKSVFSYRDMGKGNPYVTIRGDVGSLAEQYVKENLENYYISYEGEQFVARANPFKDVKDDKFYFDSVMWAYHSGITTGKDATHFNPTGNCTRAQVVTFLWRAAGCPEPESSVNPFPDVSEGKYYTKAVLWAVENGITAGFKDGSFGPDKSCTRAQIVTFLWRYMDQPTPESMANPFPDVDVDEYYGSAVLWAVEQGITTGYKDGSFGPNKTCTRDQIVTFLYRAMAK